MSVIFNLNAAKERAEEARAKAGSAGQDALRDLAMSQVNLAEAMIQMEQRRGAAMDNEVTQQAQLVKVIGLLQGEYRVL